MDTNIIVILQMVIVFLLLLTDLSEALDFKDKPVKVMS